MIAEGGPDIFLSGSAISKPSSFAFSFEVGLRLKVRTYNSSMISAGAFFSIRRRPTRLPAAIFCVVVSPLSRCSDCDSVGSSLTSHEQTVSRVARPKVVRKYVETWPSAICTARAPNGRPGNLFLVSVTWLMQS